jgi:hypothetical protein
MRMPRGGANGGPQYNPANISATGGAGQSGKNPARYYSGGTYGEGKAMMEQQQGAPLAATPAAPKTPITLGNLPPVTPITAPTQYPEEPVTTGLPVGPGAGPEALLMPQSQDADTDVQRLMSYLPALEAASLRPESSQAFRNYVRVLRAQLL